jgi:hypothetical protein
MLGFFGFTQDNDLLLDKMFLDIDQIGRGHGRVLWQHAGRDGARPRRVRVRHRRADPDAAPFHESMRATWYAAKPTEEPTWTVQMYRFTLPRCRAQR